MSNEKVTPRAAQLHAEWDAAAKGGALHAHGPAVFSIVRDEDDPAASPVLEMRFFAHAPDAGGGCAVVWGFDAGDAVAFVEAFVGAMNHARHAERAFAAAIDKAPPAPAARKVTP